MDNEPRSGGGKSFDLAQRTKQFALRAIRVIQALPPSAAGAIIGRQLLRSATAVGANYRAARRGRSRAEFLAKMGLVEEEVDESRYWMELLVEAGMVREQLLHPLMREADEIAAIIVASIRTAKGHRK